MTVESKEKIFMMDYVEYPDKCMTMVCARIGRETRRGEY